MVRYTDKSHWRPVGYDGSKWVYRVVNGATDKTVPLSGYSTESAAGAEISLAVTYTSNAVTSILDVSSMSFTPIKEEEPPVEGRKKWIYVEGGSKNGGGHAYGNANAAAPVLVLDQDKTMPIDGGLSLKFKSVNSKKVCEEKSVNAVFYDNIGAESS